MTITKIQSRRGTAAQWTAANPVLLQGEFGVETDTGPKFKIGDGASSWSALAYFASGTAVSDAAPTVKGIVQLAGALGGTAAAPSAFGYADQPALIEAMQDMMGLGFLVAGSNIILSYNDVGNQLTISASGVVGGDASTNTAISVDSEIALFSSTTGKLLKRSTGSGVALLTAGVLSTIVGVDNDIIQRKAGVFVNRTMAQLGVDLAALPPTVVIEATTARTLTAADNNTIIRCTNAAATSITIPAAFSGYSCVIVRAGAAPLTLVSSGTTLNGGSLVVNAAYLSVAIIPTGIANTFDIIGSTGDIDTAEEVVASAATTAIGATASRNVSVTGVVAITSFGTVGAGIRRWGRFTGVLTLTHNATSLILPNGGDNITTAAGDSFTAVSLGAGNWMVTHYQRVSGAPVSGKLSAVPSVNNSYEGGVIVGRNAAATLTQWQAVFLTAAGTWDVAAAGGAGTFPCRGIAVAGAAGAAPAIVLDNGVARNDAWAWTVGGDIYMSATAGVLTQTAPAATGNKIQRIGYALSATSIRVNIGQAEYLTAV